MRLTELRKRAGMSQAELAKALNCSQNIISQYENGIKSPSISKLKEIADFFQVTVDYLLSDVETEIGPSVIINRESIDKAIEDNEKLKVATRAFDLIMQMPPEMQKAAITQLQALAELNKS